MTGRPAVPEGPGRGETGSPDRRRQTAHAAAAHTAEQERRRAAEAEQAGELIRRFADRARAQGLRPSRLRAAAIGGRRRYRTDRHGWYIHRNRLYAVGVDGEFYLLTVRADGLAWLRGVPLAPHPPALVLGRGGRDGDAVPLRLLLERRLDAGDDWP